MSKKIVIIESDAGFSERIRKELESTGFTVAETADGKAAVDTVKRETPDLVVLAVELAAGQSGYIVCGKLKKDDELKKIPVVIIGKDAEGFESHKRLKARAEEYLKKPFDPPALIEKVGALIGLPAGSDDLLLDESLGSLGEDEPLGKPEEVRGGDPDLDMLDAAFEGLGDEEKPKEEAVSAPPEEGLLEDPPPLDDKPLEVSGDADTALGALDPGIDDEIALDALEPIEEVYSSTASTALEEDPTRPPTSTKPLMAIASDGEAASLRDRVSDLEARVRELEDEVAAKTNELDAVRSTTGSKDKEFFTLKDQNNKKDKEILRLKQDLNEKETEVIELREKETGIEQRISELTTDLAKKDAEVKTLKQRQESDRKKLDASLNQSKDEIRTLNARLSTAQGELDQAQETASEAQKQLDEARSQADSAHTALDALKSEFETAKADAEKAASLEEELSGLRSRLTELEESTAKNEERAIKAYQKIKLDEKARDKAKKALSVALQILEEAGGSSDEDAPTDEATAS